MNYVDHTTQHIPVPKLEPSASFLEQISTELDGAVMEWEKMDSNHSKFYSYPTKYELVLYLVM